MKLACLAPIAALALAACTQPDKPVSTGLSVSEGRLVLPAAGGNPGAAYFTLSNGGPDAASLAGVSIEGAAKAEMHETMGGSMTPISTLTLGPGATVKFEPGGKHVMVFRLPSALKAGGTAKLTLTFSGGQKLSAPLTVETPGGMSDHGDMP